MLLYETDDGDFADSAIETLRAAGIDSYRTGGTLLYAKSDPTVCIHIRREGDYTKANAILIGLGAVVDRPLKLPSLRTGVLIALAALLLAVYIVTGSR